MAHLKSRPVPSLCCSQQLGGQLGEDVCNLVQGTVEMLQLSGMGLKGKLPHCLFDAKSTLFQVRSPVLQSRCHTHLVELGSCCTARACC